jgi:hypothetical protein
MTSAVALFSSFVSTSQRAPSRARELPQTAPAGPETIGRGRADAPRASKASVFAVGLPAGRPEQIVNPFNGTTAVTILRQQAAPQIEVFAGDPTRVARRYDAKTDTAVYVVGRCTHPSHAGEALLKWSSHLTATDKEPSGFRQLIGPFVLIVDDRRNRRVKFVTDALGRLPWFTGTFNGRLIAGTDVLGICDAGLSAGEVDYDSVASWLCYNFVSTGGSVVRDYTRAPAGAVATFEPDGASVSSKPYARLMHYRNVLTPDELVEGLHDRAQRSLDAVLRGIDEINLPLSGGYDSRLLCAMLSQRRGIKFNATVVQSTPNELLNASRVASALGIPLNVMPCERSKVDLFADPLYFMPEGFPTPRNLTNAVARLRPGVPLLSGYLGDGIMRGSMTPGGMKFMALDDDGLSDTVLARETHERCLQLTNKLHLLRDPIGLHAIERATESMRDAIRAGRATGRPIAYTNIYVRQRLYFAHIFLSHLDVADALLPLTSWELVQYNASHVGSFTGETYDQLFAKFFPKLAGIPHNFRLDDAAKAATKGHGKSALRDAKPTRHLRRWASELLRGVPRKASWTAITPRKLFRRLPGAFVLDRTHADALGYLHRIHSFEQRLERAGVRVDWSRI